MIDTHVLNRDGKGYSPVDRLQPEGSVSGADEIGIIPKRP